MFHDLANHPNLHPDLNAKIQASQIAGGAYIDRLPEGKVGYKVHTLNRTYTLTRTEEDGWTIQGHPVYCPEPTKCQINGSTWGGSMLKIGFIGRGMRLEVVIPDRKATGIPARLLTSEVQEVEEF